jgi:hypothetical protein
LNRADRSVGHRLNPNALLVLLGTVIYVVVGGPWVVAGGITIALGLGALHRPREGESGGDGPMSLFGTPVTVVSQRPAALGPYLRAVPVMA